MKKPPRLTGGIAGRCAEKLPDENASSEDSRSKFLTFGIFRSCESFALKAVEVGHPIGKEPGSRQLFVRQCNFWSRTQSDVLLS